MASPPRLAPLAAAPACPEQRPAPLLSLQRAPQRQLWRKRAPEDWDEVEREGTGKRARVQLRSLCFGGGDAGAGAAPGAAPTAFIEFCNASGIPVRILWLDWDGHELPYTTLQPGEAKLYRTFPDHVWLCRCADTARRMCIDGAQAVVAYSHERHAHKVAITCPPPLAWSQAAHHAFPAAFRAQARALLLCWQRLSCECDGSSEPAATPSSSSSYGGGSSSGSGGPASSGGGGATLSADLGSLPLDLVHAILQRAAPADLWQDGRAALAPGIAPVRLRSDATLKQLVAASGVPPPPSRLPLDAVVPRLAGPAEPRSPLGALGNLMAALFPNH